MKVVVTGSLGNAGKPVAEKLVEKGHGVAVISSKVQKQKDIEALGAEAAIGSVEDVDFLVSAFTGAGAVFAVVPPNFTKKLGLKPRPSRTDLVPNVKTFKVYSHNCS